MVKGTRVAFGATLVGLAVGVCLFGSAPSARALSTDDKPAAIVVWPKVVVDTPGMFTGGAPEDTVIQLSNTSGVQKVAHCFYVNANSHCVDNPSAVCETANDCQISENRFSACDPGWQELDFTVVLTADQPIAWYASTGIPRDELPLNGPGICDKPAGRLCTGDQECASPGGKCLGLGQSNVGTSIPPVPEDPFRGSLKCIEFTVGSPSLPDTSNTLKGEATILTDLPASFIDPSPDLGPDVQKYNAVGLLSTGTSDGNPTRFQIGGDTGAEYLACPKTLILTHLFDGAVDPAQVEADDLELEDTVRTDLTLVPCGDDFLNQIPGRVTAQFFVFNEFEQRFSTSRTVNCFLETQLSRIDTPNPNRSIFSAGVSGTIAGQTRIQGVGNAATGRGLLGVAQLFVFNDDFGVELGAAYNLHQQGNPNAGTQADVITIPMP